MCYLKFLIFLSILTIITTQKVDIDVFTTFSPIDIIFASECIWNATREILGNQQLITILNCNITKEPGYSIMSTVTKMLHKTIDNYTVCYEITNGTQNFFPSFEKCIDNCNSKNKRERIYKKVFKTPRQTKMYLVFIDNLQVFKDNLKRIDSMMTYNISAEFLLVYTNLEDNTKDLAEKIIKIAYDHFKYEATLLIPAKKDVFELYMFNLYPNNSIYCAVKPETTLINTCTNGKFNLNVYRYATNYSRLNCTIRSMLMHNPPYVISPKDGFEVLILNEIAKSLNVSFEKSYYSISGSWGYKNEEGNWTGPLYKLQLDPFQIGVGAVSVRQDRLQDFGFSLTYFTEKRFWVVPAAERISDWRLFYFIFSFSTLMVLMVIMVIVGVLFWVTTNFTTNLHQDKSLLSLGAAILLSVQVTLSAPVSRQPVLLINRILFISYALFFIIVGSFYQSALFKLLTQPQYEHQISTFDEIVQSSLPIGGAPYIKEYFNNPEDDKSMLIYNKYKYFSETEGNEYWMDAVANREAIAILRESYIEYYDKTPEMRNADGSSKIFVLSDDDNVVYVDPYSIIFSQNYVLKKQFDIVIDKLIAGGFIDLWNEYYIYENQVTYLGPNNENNSTGGGNNYKQVVLSIHHLAAAFNFLFLGLFSGVCAFIFEIIIKNVLKSN